MFGFKLQITKIIKEKHRFSRSCVKRIIVMRLAGHDLLFSMKFSNADHFIYIYILRKHFQIVCKIKDLSKEYNLEIHSNSKKKVVFVGE